MDGLQEKRARELVKMLDGRGDFHGLILVQGTVVVRGIGAPYDDTPTTFDAADLQNATELGLLEKQQMDVDGQPGWEWYIVRRTPEERIRNFVSRSPDLVWQQPVGEQMISEFPNGGHCCITSQGINFWDAEGKLSSCSHTPVTRARYDRLIAMWNYQRSLGPAGQ